MHDSAAVNRIHPTAVIGEQVQLGTGNTVGPYAVILGPCVIGDDNWIGPHVVIGTPGEMRGGLHPAAWADETGVGPTEIGSRNVIREFTTVQQGHVGSTRIGDECYVMTKAHIPHDGWLGDRVTVSCGVLIGGHTVVADGANLGLGTVLHQHLAVGAGSMVGMGSVVTRDIEPYAMVYGNPARTKGANVVGLERAGFDAARIVQIDECHRSAGDLSQLLAQEMERFRHQVAESRRTGGDH
jgi:UDP-N-acetylglucosamine acyltransferase